MDNNIKFSPATQAVVERLTEELKQLTTEQLESMIRDMLKQDMRELRRKYPEAFPASARPLALAMLRRYASMSAWNLSEVAHWARGGVDEAHQVLGEMAAEYLNRGEPVPAILAAYAIEQLHPRIGRRGST